MQKRTFVTCDTITIPTALPGKSAGDATKDSERSKPMHSNLTKPIRAWARNACSLFRDGECIQDDCACHVLHPSYTIRDGGINCDYFLTEVLPSDIELFDRVQAEMHQTDLPSAGQIKKCARCGKHFSPRSNRQMYCAACSVEEKTKKNAGGDNTRNTGRTNDFPTL